MNPLRKNRKTLLLAGIALVVIGIVLTFIFKNSNSSATTFRLAKAERGPIVQTVSSSGTLSAVITVQVGSQVSGQVKALYADFNSEVKEAQVIARIDPETFETKVRQSEAELAVARSNISIQQAGVERARTDLENAKAAHAAARAQIEKARAALAEAKRTFDRRQALIKSGAISRSQIDEAEAAHDQAQAQLGASEAQAQAEASAIGSREAALKMAEAQVKYAIEQVKQREAALEQARVDLEHTFIRSPVDGVVIERSVDVGQTVAASLQAPKLFIIAQDLRKMQVETNVDEADIGRVQVGQQVTFTVDAFPGRAFSGRVEQIRKAPQTIQNVVTYTVVVSAENADLKLLPGMTANVKIIVDQRASALKVPNAALRFRPDGEPGGTVAASAGSPSAPGEQPSGGQGPGGRVSPEEQVKSLTRELNLNGDQQSQVKAIFSEARDRIMALRQQGATAEDIRLDLQRMREQGRSAILAILTPGQAERYQNLSRPQDTGLTGKGRVYVLGPDKKPRPVEVVTGLSDGAFTEIVSGPIEAGEQVILGKSDAPVRRPAGGPRLGL